MENTEMKNIVRQSYQDWAKKERGVTRERILNDSQFENTRKNNTEFGVVSTITNSFLFHLKSEINEVRINKVRSKIFAKFNQNIKNGLGAKGERTLQPENATVFLLPFFGVEDRVLTGYDVQNLDNISVGSDILRSYNFMNHNFLEPAVWFPVSATYARLKCIVLFFSVSEQKFTSSRSGTIVEGSYLEITNRMMTTKVAMITPSTISSSLSNHIAYFITSLEYFQIVNYQEYKVNTTYLSLDNLFFIS